MSRFQGRLRAARRPAGWCALLSALAMGGAAAQAPSSPADMSAADRAKRDAEKVFQWIRIHSDKPRKAAAPAAPADKPAAAAVPRAATRAARAPEGTAEATRAQSAAPARPAEPAPAPAPALASTTSPAVAVDASAPQVMAPPVEEDLALTAVVKTEPEFPSALMRQLRKGVVQVGFTVKPDGSVTQVHAVASTHPRLVSAALSTVAQWRFQPLRHAQQAVVDLGFNLD